MAEHVKSIQKPGSYFNVVSFFPLDFLVRVLRGIFFLFSLCSTLSLSIIADWLICQFSAGSKTSNTT